MTPVEKPNYTRFRAYQLGTAGSSFSYFCEGHFTLVEARLTEHNRTSIQQELKNCDKEKIDTLHISSWDQDHCSLAQLEEILEKLRPSKIEYPGYEPATENGKACLGVILEYRQKTQKVDPKYIDSLNKSVDLAYQDVFYGPKFIYDDPNDNSTVKFFRQGSFTLLSLGDVENPNISSRIRRSKFIKKEMDILMLPHHGADNGFLSAKFLKQTKPKFAVCCADFNNKFEHPKDAVRQLLKNRNIDLFTTKTGDVIAKSLGAENRQIRVVNLQTNSTEICREETYHSKRGGVFSRLNSDSYRNYHRGNKRY